MTQQLTAWEQAAQAALRAHIEGEASIRADRDREAAILVALQLAQVVGHAIDYEVTGRLIRAGCLTYGMPVDGKGGLYAYAWCPTCLSYTRESILDIMSPLDIGRYLLGGEGAYRACPYRHTHEAPQPAPDVGGR
jgi:hypothetical protein